VNVYRANVALIGGPPKRYNRDAEGGDITPMQPILPLLPPVKVDPSFLSLSYLLSAETRAEVHFKGPVGPEDIEMLRDQLEMTIRALSRKQKGENPQ